MIGACHRDVGGSIGRGEKNTLAYARVSESQLEEREWKGVCWKQTTRKIDCRMQTTRKIDCRMQTTRKIDCRMQTTRKRACWKQTTRRVD
jgi:hypothetical protein